MTMKQYNLSEDDLRVKIFKALADNPISTRHLPGFDLIKTT